MKKSITSESKVSFCTKVHFQPVQLALFLHSKIWDINCFRRKPMSLNSHWNGGRHFPLLMISLIERITPIPQLPAPTPVVVCCGMLIRGKGRHSLGWFHCSTLNLESFERTLKPFNMFLITGTVLRGGTIFKPSSKWAVLLTASKQRSPQCRVAGIWIGVNNIYCIYWAMTEIPWNTVLLVLPMIDCNMGGTQHYFVSLPLERWGMSCQWQNR